MLETVTNLIIEFILGKNKMKPAGFSNLDQIEALEVIKVVIPLMNNLLADMEVIAEYFDRLIDINDGILDSFGLYVEPFPVLIACLEQSFGALKSIVSWNGFTDQNQLPLLKSALGSFARLKKLKSNAPLKNLTEEALTYLDRFPKVILNIGTYFTS